MFGDVFAAALGVQSGDIEGDCVDGIESCALEESQDGVEGEA